MSITSRINEMSTHIEQAYDELQGLGADLTNVNKNIENISMVLDDIYDSMPQVSGEGTSLTLDDTRVGKIKSTLKGNTSQDGTPTPSSPIPVNVVSGDNEINICGKNLFDSSTFSLKTYGGSNNSARCSQSQVVPLKAGKYVFTTNLDLSVYDYKCDVLGEPPQTVSTETYIINSGFITNVNTWTLNLSQAQEGYLGILIRKKDNTNLDLETIKSFQFQLEKTSATTYEPYQGNTYNIDLPVENLLQLPNVSTTSNGVTSTITDGKLKIVGTTTTNWFSICDLNIPLESGTYTFSYTNKKVNRYNFNIKYADNTTQVIYGNAYSNTPITLSQKATITGLFSDNNTTGATFDYEDYLMIEKGSKANSYTPYGTTPIEMCSNKDGTKRDYLFHDKALDKWYWHREIGKNIYTGASNENWRTGDYGTNSYRILLDNAMNITDTTAMISNLFKGVPYTERASAGNNIIYFDSDNAYIRNTSYTSLADFKTMLGTTNMTLYYVLATPTNTEITYQLLIDQLNELEKAMSKDGQTNISQVNNDLPFIISASALKEWSV